MRNTHRLSKKQVVLDPTRQPDDEKLHQLIQKRAYELYLKRDREDGHECEDWLEAERELLSEMEIEGAIPAGPLAPIRAA